jgi:hypothetical protein
MTPQARKPLSIPPLISGGLMLSYRCTNACRHCLYRCGPEQPDEWMTEDTAERVLQALAQEPRLESIHLAGGEPFLWPDLLERVLRLCASYCVPVDYVETNAFWAADFGKAVDLLTRMAGAGLRSLLVSASMFHNEFIPFERTQTCIEAAASVFGPHNVIVWTPQVYDLLGRLPDPAKTHTLAEFCEHVGIPYGSRQLPRLYGLTAGGRVPSGLRDFYDPLPADAFHGEACLGDLMCTTHFHVDPHGHFFTGLCAGLAPATADDVHPLITDETFPVFSTLCIGGPTGLMQTAADQHGFRPRAKGYISKCDLCFDVRRHLESTGRFPELRPSSFYTGD